MATANIIFNGKEFDLIKQFDCHVLDLAYNHGGSYMTVIPISHLRYRENYPTQAKVEVRKTDLYTYFDIFDDWGRKHVVQIANTLTGEIAAAIESAREQQLLQEQP